MPHSFEFLMQILRSHINAICRLHGRICKRNKPMLNHNEQQHAYLYAAARSSDFSGSTFLEEPPSATMLSSLSGAELLSLSFSSSSLMRRSNSSSLGVRGSALACLGCLE